MGTNRIKRFSLLFLCLFFFIGFSVNGLSQPKTLVIGHGGEPAHLNPLTLSQPSMDRVFNISEPLVYLDADANPIPALAIKWEVAEGKKWRFHLRKDVTFHNGDKFTAKDVAFTIDYAKDPKNKCERRGLVKDYTYEIIDDYTINIIHEKGTIDPILPAVWYCILILPADGVAKIGIDKFTQGPIGTGPFQFVEWKKGEHVILKAYDKYWGGKAKIDTIIYKTIPEAATRIVGLKTGDLDIITDPPPVEVKSIEANPKLEIRKKASLYSMHLQLRCDISPFKDNINLRKAVGHAIDSEAITKQVLGGFGIPEGSVTPNTAFGYNKNVKPYKYDPGLAKEFLKKSGYKGEEIKYVSSNGRYFMDIEVNTAIAGYLKAIGLNIKLELNDWPTWIDKFTNHKIEPIFLVGWCDNSGDGVENLFDTAHIDSPYNWLDKGGIPEVNQLITTAKTVLDKNARREAMEKANQILNDYYYYGMCYTPVKVFGVRKGVKWSPRADETIYISNKDEKN
jgi:peptide/nickel transport system substrate-binding protein